MWLGKNHLKKFFLDYIYLILVLISMWKKFQMKDGVLLDLEGIFMESWLKCGTVCKRCEENDKCR
jgi:hypothetical protein